MFIARDATECYYYLSLVFFYFAEPVRTVQPGGQNQEVSGLPDCVVRQPDAHSGGGGLKGAKFYGHNSRWL
ncbi:MAG: hypothetical protein A3D13_03875 [Planctomycetes bacterium RIFCSPHIGHO2_02_FULL_40_12]|nr:MAG: hypothetical protein A3D13_03875 [Planctomycetes bacterium RIFCSPHIGHO2_02_FULL_40_12]OHC01424.1 MAG: hypothetical protein A3H23_02510 [Planctomycetes bacterium RIFCSPLOWO2_12_FULL_40_19]